MSGIAADATAQHAKLGALEGHVLFNPVCSDSAIASKYPFGHNTKILQRFELKIYIFFTIVFHSNALNTWSCVL